jgi:glycogen debranching enzyme
MGTGPQFDGESAPVAPNTVTVLSGATFALSYSSGDIDTKAPMGFFSEDSRLISQWALQVGGHPVQPLSHLLEESFRCRFVGQVMSGSSRLLVERDRYVGNGLHEDIVVTNLGRQAVTTEVTLEVGSDFADLFAVKESRAPAGSVGSAVVDGSALTLTAEGVDHGTPIGIRIEAPGAIISEHRLRFPLMLEPRGEWRGLIHARPMINGHVVPASFPTGRPTADTQPSRRLEQWRQVTSVIRSSNSAVSDVLACSREDLGGLRIFESDHDQTPVVAAGSPWFMTLFGRDSLLTAYMAMTLDPSLAFGVIETLARHQGTQVVEATEEQPGRILHEVRFEAQSRLHLGGKRSYYGTIDATPLFVALLGECARWHGASDRIRALLPAADKAMAWIDDYGDRDGDGFVEYERMTDKGLANQGWKDSWDGITFADGTIAKAPIALCEVQGYVYAAFRARAFLAELYDDPGLAASCRSRAAQLKQAFNDRFWLPERGWFAIGLDRDKRPIDALASNMGQALAMGIVDAALAPQVAQHLVSPPLFSGWGVRTLASTMGAYDPLSYHNGSVWPHDNALIAYGLMRRGFVREAQLIAEGILAVADSFGGRLPELFGGLGRDSYARPVPYPTSCSPQAWASAAPVHLARALLGLEPSIPDGVLRLQPRLLPGQSSMTIDGLSLAGGHVDVHVSEQTCRVEGLPKDMRWVKRSLNG